MLELLKASNLKQKATYEIICSTFLLELVQEHSTLFHSSAAAIGSVGSSTREKEKRVVEKLRRMAVKSKKVTSGSSNPDQLLMFLTGPAGCGKSHCLYAARKFCKEFCCSVAIPFDKSTFYFTSCTGASAALWDGVTIHSAAFLYNKAIKESNCRDWDGVRFLVVDEISYFPLEALANLDSKLRRLRNRPSDMYGGISIIFAGDFHQIRCVNGKPLFMQFSTHWQGSINCTIFLEGMHRFKDDPEWGRILGRIRAGQDTEADRKKINERFLGLEEVELPDGGDVCYAVFKNNERNSISAGVFNDLIQSTHPSLSENEDEIPEHTILIESTMKKSSSKRV